MDQIYDRLPIRVRERGGKTKTNYMNLNERFSCSELMQRRKKTTTPLVSMSESVREESRRERAG